MFVQYEDRRFPYNADIVRDLSFPLHLHKQVELLYVLEGEIEMGIDSRKQLLRRGEMGVAFPNSAHSYLTREHSRAILVIFEATLSGDCAETFRTQLPDAPFLPAGALPEDALFLLPRLTEPMEVRLLKGYLQIISARLFPELALAGRETHSETDWTHRALTFLNEHYTEPLTLDGLSAALGISKYHLSRTFPEKIGCGLNAYLNSLRADHAATLLVSTELSVTQAGFDSGFESTTTFFRVFKENYGISPRAYRREMRLRGEKEAPTL